MNYTTKDFDFDLPEELIAQTPLKDRTSSRLLVVDKTTHSIEDKHFSDLLDELEEALIMSDVGMETSVKIINNLRDKIKTEKIEDADLVKQALRNQMKEILDSVDSDLKLNTKDTQIIVETDDRERVIKYIEENFEIIKERKYGRAIILFLKYKK